MRIDQSFSFFIYIPLRCLLFDFSTVEYYSVNSILTCYLLIEVEAFFVALDSSSLPKQEGLAFDIKSGMVIIEILQLIICKVHIK